MGSADTVRGDQVKHNSIICQKKKKNRGPLAHGGLGVLVSSLASSLKVRGIACISRLLVDSVCFAR